MAVIELEVSVPQQLSSIKLEQYQRYLAIAKNVDEEEKDNEFLNLKALEIFCGLSLKDSYNLPVSMFESVIKQISNCLTEDTPLIQRFSMTGSDGVTVEFGFIPKLDEMSFGEYIDAERYITDWDNMHKAMAVLYRPIIAGKKGFYLIEDYDGADKWQDVMKDAPLNVALGAMVFFYRLGKKLSKYMIAYSQQELLLKGELPQEQMDLLRNGDGINQYMDFQEGMYEELMKSQNFHYINV